MVTCANGNAERSNTCASDTTPRHLQKDRPTIARPSKGGISRCRQRRRSRNNPGGYFRSRSWSRKPHLPGTGTTSMAALQQSRRLEAVASAQCRCRPSQTPTTERDKSETPFRSLTQNKNTTTRRQGNRQCCHFSVAELATAMDKPAEVSISSSSGHPARTPMPLNKRTTRTPPKPRPPRPSPAPRPGPLHHRPRRGQIMPRE